MVFDVTEADFAERVVAKIPDSIRTLDVELVRGEVHIARGNYLDAEAVLERAFAAYPDSVQLRRVLAPVLLELGSFARALTVLQPVLAGGGTLADVKVVSQIYRALGREADADRAYRDLVARRPHRTPTGCGTRKRNRSTMLSMVTASVRTTC